MRCNIACKETRWDFGVQMGSYIEISAICQDAYFAGVNGGNCWGIDK